MIAVFPTNETVLVVKAAPTPNKGDIIEAIDYPVEIDFGS